MVDFVVLWNYLRCNLQSRNYAIFQSKASSPHLQGMYIKKILMTMQMSGKVPLNYSKFKKTANWAVPAPVRDGKVESESVRVIWVQLLVQLGRYLGLNKIARHQTKSGPVAWYVLLRPQKVLHFSHVDTQYRQNREHFNKSNRNVSTKSHRPSHPPLLIWQNSHSLVNPTHSLWPTIN